MIRRSWFLALLATLVAGAHALNFNLRGDFAQTDFAPVYVAARLYNSGQSAAVYAIKPYTADRPAAWAEIEESLPNGGFGTVFPYSPAYLLAIAPLVGALPYERCVALWFGINLLLAVYLSLRLALLFPHPKWRPLVLILAVASSNALQAPLGLGQNFLLCLFGIVCFLDAWRRQAWLWLAFAYLLACACKPWAFLLIGLPILERDWKRFLLLAASGLVFVGLQHLTLSELWSGYLRITAEHTQIGILAYNNYSLSAALRRLTMPDWSQYALWKDAGAEPIALSLLRGLLLLPVMFAGWLSRRRLFHLHCAATTVFLLGNVYWDYYALMNLPFALFHFLNQKYRWPERTLVGILIVTVFIPPHSFLYELISIHGPSFLSFSAMEKTAALVSATPSLLILWVYLRDWQLNENPISDWRRRLLDFGSFTARSSQTDTSLTRGAAR